MNILNLNLWKTVLLAGLMLAVLLHPEMAGATTRTVTTTSDSGAGSLRQTIIYSAAGDTINFSASGTITLTSGELPIARDLTIIGPGANVLSVSGNNAGRVFNISGGITVNISSLAISGGFTNYAGNGAGIYNGGTLTISNCTISSNVANDGGGGGIYNGGTLTINNCTISDNAAGDGAGIYNGATLTINNCTISGNNTYYYVGGGIHNTGTLTVNNSTISGNVANDGGGGIYNGATLTINNCTISGNHTLSNGANGGGIANANSLTMINTIIANNTASYGAGPDVDGAVSSQGRNLIGRTDGSSGWFPSDLLGGTNDATRLDPQLGPLQDNGGPTFTMALLPTSAAIDAGDDAVLGPPYNFVTDQRGRPRKIGAHVDIGAVEVGPVTLVVTNSDDGGAGSLRDAILVAAPGETVAFAPNVTGTITLTTGELALGKNVNINGPGAKVLTVSGNNASRVFHVTSGASQISNLRIANGHASDGGGGVAVEGDSSLTVTGCAINNCYADGSGLTADGGGGIYVGPVTLLGSPTLSLNACTLSGNSSRYYGGGLLMFNAANVSLVNCTVSGNSTLDNSFGEATGGGIYLQSTTLNITSSTVANNSSVGNGGGIYRVNGTVTIGNSMIAGNTALAGPDCSGQLNKGIFTSAGYNLIGKTNGSTGFSTTSHDQVGSIASPLNPLIGPLQDNGGPTLTHALLGGSPAIDKGKSFGVTTDQRGSVRPYDDGSIPNASGGDGSDIGAFEAQAPSGQPLLTIATSGTGVVIAWPSPSTGFVLQQNISGLSSANWSTVLTTPNDDGTTKTIIVDPATGNQYFRLLHQ